MQSVPLYGRTAYLQATAALGVDPFMVPEDEASWRDWYQYRLDAYYGNTYTQALIKAAQLFRALDDDGKIIALTRRLHRDIQHVVDVGTGAIGAGLVLRLGVGLDEGTADRARSIWRRSGRAHVGTWSRLLCAMGDYYLEPVRIAADQVQLVGYDARVVVPEYSTDGRGTLEKVTITHQFAEMDTTVSPDGSPVVSTSAKHVYRRVLTATSIEVWLDGELVEEESGDHGLGVVPIVHLRAIPSSEPEHSLWIGHGVDRGIAEVDSLMSMISAIGDRAGNPKLEIKGAKVADESKISRWGRIMNFHGGSKDALAAAGARYIEPTLAGVKVLHDALVNLLADIRASMPEFIFGNAGANASGKALELRSAAFKTKYREIRDRHFAGISRVLAMATAMEIGQALDDGLVQEISFAAPPLVPVDVKSALDAIAAADALGVLTLADKIRAAQRLDLLDPDIPIEEQIAALQEEKGSSPEEKNSSPEEKDNPASAEPTDQAPPEQDDA